MCAAHLVARVHPRRPVESSCVVSVQVAAAAAALAGQTGTDAAGDAYGACGPSVSPLSRVEEECGARAAQFCTQRSVAPLLPCGSLPHLRVVLQTSKPRRCHTLRRGRPCTRCGARCRVRAARPPMATPSALSGAPMRFGGVAIAAALVARHQRVRARRHMSRFCAAACSSPTVDKDRGDSPHTLATPSPAASVQSQRLRSAAASPGRTGGGWTTPARCESENEEAMPSSATTLLSIGTPTQCVQPAHSIRLRKTVRLGWRR